MAPGPLGVGWAGSLARESGPGTPRVRKPSLLFRRVPFLRFCYFFGFIWYGEGEVRLDGIESWGLSRATPPHPLFFPLTFSPLRLFSHLLGFTLAQLFMAQAEGIGVARRTISVSLSLF